MDYITIGSSPAEEQCVQVGTDNYDKLAREECVCFIALIRKYLGDEPTGAILKVKSFPHDFGSYYEVVCHYDERNDEAAEYAYKCEGEAPTKWDN